jgi:hypothetical protein
VGKIFYTEGIETEGEESMSQKKYKVTLTEDEENILHNIIKAKKAHEGGRKPGNMALSVPVRRPSATPCPFSLIVPA